MRRTYKGQVFVTAEMCANEFDAHDAAHVYRSHENLCCRLVRTLDGIAVLVGGPRRISTPCRLRWCPSQDQGVKKFFVPSTRFAARGFQ